MDSSSLFNLLQNTLNSAGFDVVSSLTLAACVIMAYQVLYYYNTNFQLYIIFLLIKSGKYLKADRDRERNRIRNRKHALDEMDNMSDAYFKRMFRMSKRSFQVLLDRLCEEWGDSVCSPESERMGIFSSGSSVSAKTRLAITLRFLAGGSYLDICFAFGVALGSFYVDGGILWKTIETLDHILDLGFPFENENELKRISKGLVTTVMDI